MPLNAKTEFERELLLKKIDEMAAEIAHLDDQLAQSNRLATLGILAGMIAHEFNNLLTPVMSYSQLAISSPNDQELVTKAMTRTLEGTERLSHIASSILGFMRNDCQLQTCTVSTVVEETITCLVRQPEKHGIQIIKQVPAGLRVQIRPVALQQILMNLLLNAIQSMQKQGGKIRIEAGLHLDDEKNDVIIAITDTGPGISPEVLQQVFDPLTLEDGLKGQDHTNYRILRHAAGNGLGLAVCRRLIEDAGGAIEVKNKPGGSGAVFYIHLNQASTASITAKDKPANS